MLVRWCYVNSSELKLIDLARSFGINNQLELAHLLAQYAHESANFTRWSEAENFRYKTARRVFCANAASSAIHAARLAQINAKQIELRARDDDFCPQPWLFNLVYGARMGNQLNGILDNDGYDYRGGGVVQLTGKANYQGFLNWLQHSGQQLNLTLETIDEFVRSADGALLVGIWFWLNNDLGKYARLDDVTRLTQAINGGLNGLHERSGLTAEYKRKLGI